VESPNLETLYTIRTDGSRRKMHPADVRGRFVRARRLVILALIGVMLALPLVKVHQHPLVHIDIAARHFYLFGAVFNATDTWMLVFLFAAGAFGLLWITATLGRSWCGWACPQSVFHFGD
jgi:polyferredoxin